MTEHPLVLVRDRVRETPVKPKHPLGELDAARIAKHLVLFKPALENVDLLVAKARAHIPGMTNNLTVHKVVSHNQDCLWAIGRRKRLEAGDTVAMSSRIIPGNEKNIYRMINHISKRGADVVYGSMNPPIHVSGHGSAEELRLVLNLVRPKYFVPVHGEYRQLSKHAQLAQHLKHWGLEDTFILESGDTLEIEITKIGVLKNPCVAE